MAELKNTPLREFHQEMGAKMVPLSGWNLPLNFSEGAQDEHLYCREKAALFDFCADGRFRIAFEGAGKALEKYFFANEGAFAPGKCFRTFLVDSEGNALAPCRAGMMAEDDFFLTVPFGSVDRAVALFAKEKLEYTDLSEYLCTIAVAGPRTLEVLEKCQVSADMLPAPGEIKLLEIDGLRAIVSYFDDFGEEGFEISFNADCADQIWDLFLETDIPWPAGLAAQESLRIEEGVISTPELLIPKKGCELESRIGTLLFEGRRLPFAGVKLFDSEEHEKGVVTSSAFSPTLESAAALVYFPDGVPAPGTELHCDASGITITGTVSQS
jgi:aminomethyltransferase